VLIVVMPPLPAGAGIGRACLSRLSAARIRRAPRASRLILPDVARRKRGQPRPRTRPVQIDATGAGVTHWNRRLWRENLDEFALDPRRPQAFPARRPMDLLGRIRVWLSAEDHHLVAYGFGGQRIAIPAAEIGGVQVVEAYRSGRRNRTRALLVLDHQQRIMLRASGQWETYGEVARVCRAAGAPSPAYKSLALRPTSRSRSTARRRRPLYAKAPGYRRLRTVPPGTSARVIIVGALSLAIISGAAIAGTFPAQALPGWIGSVRVLLGIIGAVLGAAAGLWLCRAAYHLALDALRWVTASIRAQAVAPARRFFGQERSERREHSDAWSRAATVGLVALVPALIGWGPGVGIASLANGLSDSHLVATLRADGTSAPGLLIDVRGYSSASGGKATMTDVATLQFTPVAQGSQPVKAPDPPIGGRTLPLGSPDPEGTRVPVTVVYLPDDPSIAAARQQIAGSVWHGAPTANLIVGSVFTVALPPLILCLVIRIRRQRRARNATVIDDFVAAGA
jgi:hypothetical protein